MADKIVRIMLDDDPICPMDDGDGQWTLHSFNDDSIHNDGVEEYMRENDKGYRAANIGLQRKLAVGLAFWLRYEEHGIGQYSILSKNPQHTPDGVLVWENKPDDIGAKTYEDRKKDAQYFVDTYNDWMNGSVFGVQVQTVGDDEEAEIVWGCIGSDDARIVEEIKDQLEPGDRVKLEDEYTNIGKGQFPGVTFVKEFE